MKKLITIIISFAIVFCCSVPVFAATNLNTLLPDLFIPDDTNSVVGTIDYTSIPAVDKPFYIEVMNAVSGKSYNTDFCYFVIVNGEATNKQLLMLRIPSDVKLNTSSISLSLDKANVLTKSLSFTYYLKSSNNGLIRYFMTEERSSVSYGTSPYALTVLSTPKTSTSICMLAYSPNATTQILNSANFPNFYNNTFNGQFMFRDNNPEQPVPDPEPEKPVVPPKLPTIPPGDSNFVPYDTSVWQKFLSHVSGNIGSSTNIGLLIFAVIFGIGLVVTIVRRFSKRG